MTHGIRKGPTRNFWVFSNPPPSQTPSPNVGPEVPNPDAEVLLEIWSSDVTGDELMSSVPGIYIKLGDRWFQNWLVATQIFLYFHPGSLGFHDPIWGAYFSNGLKPQTRKIAYKLTHTCCGWGLRGIFFMVGGEVFFVGLGCFTLVFHIVLIGSTRGILNTYLFFLFFPESPTAPCLTFQRGKRLTKHELNVCGPTARHDPRLTQDTIQL